MIPILTLFDAIWLPYCLVWLAKLPHGFPAVLVVPCDFYIHELRPLKPRQDLIPPDVKSHRRQKVVKDYGMDLFEIEMGNVE